jgi:hypothetical protein
VSNTAELILSLMAPILAATTRDFFAVLIEGILAVGISFGKGAA